MHGPALNLRGCLDGYGTLVTPDVGALVKLRDAIDAHLIGAGALKREAA